MRKLLLVILAAAIALCLFAGAALAESDSGLWLGGQAYTLDMGGSILPLDTFFMGGYAAGRQGSAGQGLEYRFTYGIADAITANGVTADGHYYLVGADGGLRIGFGNGLLFHIGVGADYWWGTDDYASRYSFLQVKAGAGLVMDIKLDKLTLETEAGAYMVFDSITDEYDLSQSYLCMGMRTELGMTAIFNIAQGMALRAGLKYSFTAEQGMLTDASAVVTGFEASFGIAW